MVQRTDKMDEAIKNKYLKCKFKVKKWESEFHQANGTNPSKTDIKNAPSNIKEAYKTYWKLKTMSLETSLVDVSFGEDTMDSFSFYASCDIENSSESNIQTQGDSPARSADATEKVTKPDKSPELHSLQGCLKTENSHIEVKGNTFVNESEDLNKSSVWGTHLSKTKKVEEKRKPEKPAVLSRYSAKLFAGATFKKRNPRKAFIRREKSADDSLSQLDDSQSSLMSDFRQSLPQLETSVTCEDKTAVVEGKKDSLLDEDTCSLTFNESGTRLKIINKPQTQRQSQPFSLLQKTLISKTTTNPLGSRTVDKGWLERLDKATNIEEGNKGNSSDSGIELTDSSVVSEEAKSSSLQASILLNNDVSDDEDFVCDSDSENERTRSINSFSSLPTTKSLSRLPSFTNSDLKRASSSLSSLNPLKTEPLLLKTDKRTIDEIENDVIDTRDSKKCRVDNVLSDNVSNCLKVESKYSLPPLPSRIVKNTNQKNVQTLATQTNRLVEIQNKTSKTKEIRQEEILKRKVSSGKANENFVKINIKKKTYVRGKKTMTFQKYKKQKWKEMKKNQTNGANGVYKCFKCGDVGHFAKNCLKACDQLLPKEDLDDEEESPFPSLQDAEEMALEASKKLCVRRNLNYLPVHMINESTGANESAPPPCSATDDIVRFLTNHEPVFKLQEDGSVVDTPLVVLEALSRFGHDTWRGGQEAAVMRILSGLSTLVTLATGSGKSLCYQLPAYLYHTMQQRITLVISPLVSLMEDQVHGVPPCLRVACLHTNQSPQARTAVYSALRDNSLHLLLLSPEAIAGAERNTELLRALPQIAFAAIDEAHCISQWSHNFRPDYLTLCQILREKFGVKTFLGLTATATQATIASVSTALGLQDGEAGVIRDRPLPDNLQLSVSRDTHKDQALIQLLRGGRFCQCHSIIIYCTRRDECQRLAAYIRTCLQDVSKEDGIAKRGKLSWNAEAYHAGLTPARRKAVQKAFMSGMTRIVVATVAFGMGINKQDIQGVIHYNMPSAFERYVQEVGRAGRDGQPAHCHLFLNTEGGDLRELRRHIYADSVERHTVRKLLQRVFVPCTCGEACPSHEVAFSVSETVSALDLPEENIATLLCYLQLHDAVPVRVCSRAYTQCRLLFYKGPKLIRQAAKECPPLAMAVALAADQGCKLDRLTKFEFPIFPVASAIKWDSGVVKQQLKNLEWTKVNDQLRRSGVTVELYDLGFRVMAPGNLSAEELDSVLDSLTARVEHQEETALCQLQAIFQVLFKVSHQSVKECLDEVDNTRCEVLKSNVRHYFTEDSFLDDHALPQATLTNEGQVTSDVRTLVNCYRDVTWSGRAVARLFHGIASPNFSSQTWGRCRFWRAHLHEDFKLLSRLATRELIKLR